MYKHKSNLMRSAFFFFFSKKTLKQMSEFFFEKVLTSRKVCDIILAKELFRKSKQFGNSIFSEFKSGERKVEFALAQWDKRTNSFLLLG